MIHGHPNVKHRCCREVGIVDVDPTNATTEDGEASCRRDHEWQLTGSAIGQHHYAHLENSKQGYQDFSSPINIAMFNAEETPRSPISILSSGFSPSAAKDQSPQ
jgi:hypothetical protein